MRWLNQRVADTDLLWEESIPESWAGIDEVGRGPLAGPVVAAAVVLPPGDLPSSLDTLDDSKRLSCRERLRLSEAIKEVALGYCIAEISPEEIDTLNILAASMKAMRMAFLGLDVEVPFAFVDGNRLPELPCRAKAVVKGDQKVAAIAAASILAKVQRDSQMEERDKEFPHYGFRWHKGYATAFHRIALNVFGPCELHRKSFLPVANAATPSPKDQNALNKCFMAFHTANTLRDLEQCFSLSYVRRECKKPEVSAYFERYVNMRAREIAVQRRAETTLDKTVELGK